MSLMSISSTAIGIGVAIVCSTGLLEAADAQSSSLAFAKGAAARILIPAPGGEFESCYLPKHYTQHRDANADRKEEIKLCRLSGYRLGDVKIEIQDSRAIDQSMFKKTDTKSVVFCPKLNSTVPATNFVDLPKGWKQEEAESLFCKLRSEIPIKLDEHYSLEAKFKSTLGGASTRSVIAYYHMSRLLETGRVAPAVLRTLRRNSHEAVVQKARTALAGGTDHITGNWAALESSNTRAASGRGSPELYVDGGTQIYGALMENEKGEEKHTEVSGVGEFKTRYERFMQQAPFQKLSNSDSVTKIAGSHQFDKLAPVIVELQDLVGMILLDVLMAQADRIGNVHYKISVIEHSPDGVSVRDLTKEEKAAAKDVLQSVRAPLYEKSRIAFEKGDTRTAANLRARADKIKLTEKMVLAGIKKLNAVKTQASAPPTVAKIIILKDNDAGFSGNNPMKNHGALEKVRHMDPVLYRRFLKLADDILTDRFKDFAKDTLLLRDKDYEGGPNSLKENTRYAVRVLKDLCRSGQLKFDLGLNFDRNGLYREIGHPGCE